MRTQDLEHGADKEKSQAKHEYHWHTSIKKGGRNSKKYYFDPFHVHRLHKTRRSGCWRLDPVKSCTVATAMRQEMISIAYPAPFITANLASHVVAPLVFLDF